MSTRVDGIIEVTGMTRRYGSGRGAFEAVSDLSLSGEEGELFGLLGTNGAGKSTLLKVLSGTTFPTAGSYTVRGRVTSLLELGAGFHMPFSGRDNIYLNAAVFGLTEEETKDRFDDIAGFDDAERNMRALEAFGGDMQAVLEHYVG